MMKFGTLNRIVIMINYFGQSPKLCHSFLPRDATQSAVLLQQVVCPSVRLSVCPYVTLRNRDLID